MKVIGNVLIIYIIIARTTIAPVGIELFQLTLCNLTKAEYIFDWWNSATFNENVATFNTGATDNGAKQIFC